MSIKMSDVFGNETIENFGNIVCAVGSDDLGTFNTAKQAEYAASAISTHDEMQARIVELESLIKEADDYLNTNKLTTICNGSILHMAFKEAIKDEKGS